MRSSTPLIVLSVTGALALAGCGGTDGGEEGMVVQETGDVGQAGSAASATLQDAEGTEVGTVRFSEVLTGTEVALQVENMDPGFYGFHIHGTGLCEADSAAPDDPGTTGAFLSAGGHLGADEAEHPNHTGDLPSLYVTADGQGRLVTITDRFTADDLTGDDDGSAVMIHADPENFANVPERYAAEGPDEQTLKTGDAGSRLACGVVE